MNPLTIVALALVALASADVSHLERSYLPPSRTTTYSASHGYSTDHGSSSVVNGHNEKLITAPVHAIKTHQHANSAPARIYEAHLASPAISHPQSLSSYSSSSSQVHKAPQLTVPIVHHAHKTAPVAGHQEYSLPVALSSSSYASGGHPQAPLAHTHASHHETKNYVAPSQHVTHQHHQQIHHAPIVHHGYTAPVATHQTYLSPVAISTSSHTSGLSHHKTPVVHNPVGHTASNHVAPAVIPVHHVEHQQTHHLAPAKQSYITSHHAAPASSYSNFNSISAPAHDKYKTHSAPAVIQHYAAPAVSHTHSTASGKYAVPSVGHSYISPAVALETFSKSLGHHTPAHSLSGVLSTDSSASGYDTKYAANGGYVY